jgi:hypothetical protein
MSCFFNIQPLARLQVSPRRCEIFSDYDDDDDDDDIRYLQRAGGG